PDLGAPLFFCGWEVGIRARKGASDSRRSCRRAVFTCRRRGRHLTGGNDMEPYDGPPEVPPPHLLRRTYRYRIYPTKAQEQLLNDTLFLCCLIYNQCLEEKKRAW